MAAVSRFGFAHSDADVLTSSVATACLKYTHQCKVHIVTVEFEVDLGIVVYAGETRPSSAFDQ